MHEHHPPTPSLRNPSSERPRRGFMQLWSTQSSLGGMLIELPLFGNLRRSLTCTFDNSFLPASGATARNAFFGNRKTAALYGEPSFIAQAHGPRRGRTGDRAMK